MRGRERGIRNGHFWLFQNLTAGRKVRGHFVRLGWYSQATARCAPHRVGAAVLAFGLTYQARQNEKSLKEIRKDLQAHAKKLFPQDGDKDE